MVRSNSTRTRLIRIGNSRGIRIPKPLIELAGLGDDVDMEVRDGALVVRSSRRPRAGWEEAFARMHARGDDRLLDEQHSTHSTFDRTEWEWR